MPGSARDRTFQTGYLNPRRRRRHVRELEGEVRDGKRVALCGAGTEVWLDLDYLAGDPIPDEHFDCLNCARALPKFLVS